MFYKFYKGLKTKHDDTEYSLKEDQKPLALTKYPLKINCSSTQK